MTELLQKLSALTAPSGWEDAARDFVLEQGRMLGASAETDRLGNVILRKTGARRTKAPVVLSAYLDEPGFMIKEIMQGGLLRFGLTGDTDPRTILGRKVRVGEENLPGVVGLRPIHLMPPEERNTMPKTGELYLDVGAPDRAWAAGQIAKGDFGVFDGDFEMLGEHRFLAKAMGRSVSASVLLALLRRELPLDVVCVFTVQRLVGSRGAYAAAGLEPGCAVALDVCSGDEEGVNLPRLGGGPVIPQMDAGAFYDRKLTRLLQQGAGRKEQPCQMQAGAGDKGDGAVYRTARNGARTAALKCPVKYGNAPAQLADFRDVAAMEQELFGLLEELEAEAWI